MCVMNRFVRAICYFKYFLPADTTIESQDTCETAADLKEWMSNITRLSNTVESNIAKYIQQKRAAVLSTAENEGGPPMKKRKIPVCLNFESAYKFLNGKECSLSDFVAMMPNNVIDNATKPAGSPPVVYRSVSQFRK